MCLGNLLLVAAPGSERDVLWCLSSDPYPFHPYLVEVQTLIPLEGIVWAMAEVQGGDVKAVLPSVSSHESRAEGRVMTPDPPLVVRQHMESPRKYIILTQQVCGGALICQCFGNISKVLFPHLQMLCCTEPCAIAELVVSGFLLRGLGFNPGGLHM
jgi:hypothetical protein